MNRQYAYYKELPVGTHYSYNGNHWIKQSTRTAQLPEYDRWFYFGEFDLCVVGRYCRLGETYFTEN